MPTPLQETTVTFERGLIISKSPVATERGLTQMDNVFLSIEDEGAIEAADGYESVNVDLGVSLNKLAFFRKQNAGVEPMAVVVGGTHAWRVEVDTGNTDKLFDAYFTSGQRFGIVALEDQVCFFNGADIPVYSTINGDQGSPVTTDTMGLARPDIGGATSSLGASGNVRGTVMYFIAAVDEANEGALSEDFGRIDAQDGKIVNLSSIPMTSTGKARLYRTFADGSNPYLLDTLTGSTASASFATYNDDTADRQLGNPPLIHGDPPLSGFQEAVTHYNRIFCVKKNSSNVYWSDLNEPESWYTPGDRDSDIETFGNYITVFGDDGDRVSALARDESGLIVFKENHIYRLSGRVPDQFYMDEVTLSDQANMTVGAPTQEAITAYPGGVAFFYRGGVYTYSGGRITYISREIEDDLRGIRGQDGLGVSLGYWPNRRWVCVGVPITNGPRPSHTYFWDIASRRWVGRWSKGFSGYSIVEDPAGDQFFWGISGTVNEGLVFNLGTGQTFDGDAIASTASLPPFYGDNISALKRFMYVDVYFTPRQSGSFNVEIELDGKSTDTDTYTISQTVASTARWKERVNIGLIGRELVVRIKSTADQPRWKVYAVTYGWQSYNSVSER